MRSGRRPRAPRVLAALLVVLCVSLATPTRSLAEDEDEDLWGQWWTGVTDRSIKAEIPFAFVVTIPAMIIIAPIWLVERGIARLTRDEADDES